MTTDYQITFDSEVIGKEPSWGRGRFKILTRGNQQIRLNADFRRKGQVDNYEAGYLTALEALRFILSKIHAAQRSPELYSIELRTDYLGLVYQLTNRSMCALDKHEIYKNVLLTELEKFKEYKIKPIHTSEVTGMLGEKK